jgi:hypothetical protein
MAVGDFDELCRLLLGSLYRFKTRSTLSDLGIHEMSYQPSG